MSEINRFEELWPSDIELIKPTETVRSVLNIDFAKYAQQGIVHWGFDIEGTLAPGQTEEPEIPQEVIDHIRQAREAGFIQTLFLATNRRIRVDGEKIADTVYARKAAEILNADFFVTRSSLLRGKPNKDLVEAGYLRAGARPWKTAFVGDKSTADVRAGWEAGVGVTIWVTPRVGEADLVLDKYIRRPLELWHARRNGELAYPHSRVGAMAMVGLDIWRLSRGKK